VDLIDLCLTKAVIIGTMSWALVILPEIVNYMGEPVLCILDGCLERFKIQLFLTDL